MPNPDHPVVERTDLNPFAVVTGASRGIGAAYARVLASRGYDLLLVSRDETRLTHLARELEANHGIQAHVVIVDLSRPDAAHQLFVESRQYRQTPDMLINNAGFGLYGEFVSHPLPRIQEMLHVHVRTVVESIRLFLPGMIERGSGSIINVASIAGLLPIPHFAEYAATKRSWCRFQKHWPRKRATPAWWSKPVALDKRRPIFMPPRAYVRPPAFPYKPRLRWCIRPWPLYRTSAP